MLKSFSRAVSVGLSLLLCVDILPAQTALTLHGDFPSSIYQSSTFNERALTLPSSARYLGEAPNASTVSKTTLLRRSFLSRMVVTLPFGSVLRAQAAGADVRSYPTLEQSLAHSRNALKRKLSFNSAAGARLSGEMKAVFNGVQEFVVKDDAWRQFDQESEDRGAGYEERQKRRLIDLQRSAWKVLGENRAIQNPRLRNLFRRPYTPAGFEAFLFDELPAIAAEHGMVVRFDPYTIRGSNQVPFVFVSHPIFYPVIRVENPALPEAMRTALRSVNVSVDQRVVVGERLDYEGKRADIAEESWVADAAYQTIIQRQRGVQQNSEYLRRGVEQLIGTFKLMQGGGAEIDLRAAFRQATEPGVDRTLSKYYLTLSYAKAVADELRSPNSSLADVPRLLLQHHTIDTDIHEAGHLLLVFDPSNRWERATELPAAGLTQARFDEVVAQRQINGEEGAFIEQLRYGDPTRSLLGLHFQPDLAATGIADSHGFGAENVFMAILHRLLVDGVAPFRITARPDLSVPVEAQLRIQLWLLGESDRVAPFRSLADHLWFDYVKRLAPPAPAIPKPRGMGIGRMVVLLGVLCTGLLTMSVQALGFQTIATGTVQERFHQESPAYWLALLRDPAQIERYPQAIQGLALWLPDAEDVVTDTRQPFVQDIARDERLLELFMNAAVSSSGERALANRAAKEAAHVLSFVPTENLDVLEKVLEAVARQRARMPERFVLSFGPEIRERIAIVKRIVSQRAQGQAAAFHILQRLMNGEIQVPPKEEPIFIELLLESLDRQASRSYLSVHPEMMETFLRILERYGIQPGYSLGWSLLGVIERTPATSEARQRVGAVIQRTKKKYSYWHPNYKITASTLFTMMENYANGLGGTTLTPRQQTEPSPKPKEVSPLKTQDLLERLIAQMDIDLPDPKKPDDSLGYTTRDLLKTLAHQPDLESVLTQDPRTPLLVYRLLRRLAISGTEYNFISTLIERCPTPAMAAALQVFLASPPHPIKKYLLTTQLGEGGGYFWFPLAVEERLKQLQKDLAIIKPETGPVSFDPRAHLVSSHLADALLRPEFDAWFQAFVPLRLSNDSAAARMLVNAARSPKTGNDRAMAMLDSAVAQIERRGLKGLAAAQALGLHDAETQFYLHYQIAVFNAPPERLDDLFRWYEDTVVNPSSRWVRYIFFEEPERLSIPNGLPIKPDTKARPAFDPRRDLGSFGAAFQSIRLSLQPLTEYYLPFEEVLSHEAGHAAYERLSVAEKKGLLVRWRRSRALIKKLISPYAVEGSDFDQTDADLVSQTYAEIWRLYRHHPYQLATSGIAESPDIQVFIEYVARDFVRNEDGKTVLRLFTGPSQEGNKTVHYIRIPLEGDRLPTYGTIKEALSTRPPVRPKRSRARNGSARSA